MKKTINVGLIGVGTVGGGTADILTKNNSIIAARSTDICLKKICTRDEEELAAKLEMLNLDASAGTTNAYDIINDPEIDIVVELIGGINPAKEFILAALGNGKSVVTANKDLVATYGHEIFEAAEATGADFFFEAAVAGGIPIIRTLKESLQANNIKQIIGIVNGTTNYILTHMAQTGADFDPTLKQAQQLGYAEADPTSDVEGLDAARKMAILSSIAFNSRVTYEMVYAEGIRDIDKYDIAYAEQLGYVIKLLGIAKEHDGHIEVRVHPAMVPLDHPLASVNDVYNAVFVEGDALGNAMFYGRGAGSLPTGSAVVSDIINAASNIVNDCRGQMGCTCFAHKDVLPISKISSKYFLRMMVCDEPNVLAQITSVIGSNNVSLDAVLQKRILNSGLAEIVVVTHEVLEENMQNAIEKLRALSCVDSVPSIIRVIA